MNLGEKTWRHLAFATLFAAGSWFGCSPSDDRTPDDGAVGKTRQALEPCDPWTPSWTPSCLTPLAWYVAEGNKVFQDNGVQYWFENQNQNNTTLRLEQQFYFGRPQFQTDGWAPGRPTLHFRGISDLMRIENWSGAPAGADQPFSILAVLRSDQPQNAGIVAWRGDSALRAQLVNESGRTLLDLMRIDGLSTAQMLTGSSDLGTGRHVVAWRFDPLHQHLKLTLDGVTTTSQSLPGIAALNLSELSVAAQTLNPTGIFKGDISELVIVNTAIDDEEVQFFTTYAENKWDFTTSTPLGPCFFANGQPTPDTTRCDDLDPLTHGDHCSAGVCAGNLPATGSPGTFSPLAWYHANPHEVSIRDNGVAIWFDRTENHHDLIQGHYGGRPAFAPQGWNGNKPTVTFTNDALRRDIWSGIPGGDDAAFTILAVLRPNSAQNSAVAAFWNPIGPAKIIPQLKTTGGNTFLDLYRSDDSSANHSYTGTTALGTARHAAVWRYKSDSVKLTLDGLTTTIQGPTNLGAIGASSFVVGSQTYYAVARYDGDISELAVIPESLSDEDVAEFNSYAGQEWGGITFCTPNCAGATCGAADGCGSTCKCGTGGACQDNDDCNDGFTCEDGACTCTPSCEGQCDGPDGCGGTCKGGPGDACCQVNADCQDGLGCVRGVCTNPGCLTNPVATGCGYEGAPCGECTSNPTCTSDSDCPNGMVCPANNGWRYAVAGLRVCVRPEWGCDEPHPPGGCGGPMSNCGVCDCVPQCDGKQCGDTDLSDDCGGRCMGTCDPGELGCELDIDCQEGYICNDARCRPADPCGSPTVQPPQCGPGSLCGACPVRARFLTNGRACGTDPNTGGSLGSCPSGQFCNGAGQCAKLETTPNIFVPNADGSLREVVPQPTTPATAIGSIAGKFTVTDRGSASYTIPIDLPPGRSVMPALSLRYTSTTPNGALGAGWSLEGLSNITRCAKIYALDGYNNAWTGAPDDALCLDGQRLVRIADGTYRTAIDTFSKIEPTLAPSGQPETIKVYTKDGRILTYGENYGSRAMIWNGQVGTWALSRVEDRSGNFMRVTYRAGVETPAGSAELVPHVITYTGHGQLDGDREVEFVYDQDRPDQYLRRSGVPGSRTHRLSAITVRAQQTIVRSYHLTYEVTLNTSRLKTIKECIAPLVCKPETTFDYVPDEVRFNGGEDTNVGLCTGQSVCQGPINITAIGHTHWVQNPGLSAPGDIAGGRDWMGTTVYDTYQTKISPILGIPSFAVSFVPYVGSFATKVVEIIGAMLDSEETVLNLYDVNVRGGTVIRTGSGCPTPGSVYAVAEDPADGDGERLVMHCGSFVPTGRTVEIPGNDPPFVGVEAWATPRIWYVDVDGNGVQDKLFCDQGYLYLNMSRAQESGDAHVPSSSTTNYDARLNLPDLCRVDCNDEPLEGDPWADPPRPPRTTCAEDRPFSTIFDLDADGTGNLVFYSRLNGWFYLDYDLSDPTDQQDLYVRNDLFEGVSLSATHKNYVLVLDANGDGLRDILGLPDAQFDPGGKPVILYNSGNGFFQQTLSAQGNLGRAPSLQAFVIDYDRDGIEELIEPTSLYQDATELPHHWRLRRIQDGHIVGEQASLTGGPGTLGDFDGDGTIDAYTRAVSNPLVLHRGYGRHNGLLKTVTDGLGNRVDIDYDEPSVAQSDGASDLDFDFDSSLCKWPIRCPSRVPHPVVTSHTESHYTDHAPHSETARVSESTSRYEYGRWISEMSGFGAFGFTSRKIIVTNASGTELSQTKIDYELPVPGPRTVPYTYPTAGLVKQIIEQGPNVSSRISADYIPRRTTRRDWVVQFSTAGIAFPALQREVTQHGVRGTELVFPNTGAPYSKHGIAPSDTKTTINTIDAYGNVTNQHQTQVDVSGTFPQQIANPDSLSETTVQREYYAANEINWVIGLLKFDETTSIPRCVWANALDCATLTKRRRYDFEYYPGTKLLHVSRRQVGDADLEQNVTYERDQYGNVTAITKADANSQHSRRVEKAFDTRGLFPISGTVVGDNASHTTQVRYDDRFGTLTARADPNGIDETWTYDELGIERHRRGPQGEVTRSYNTVPPYVSDLGLAIAANTRFVTTETGGETITEDFNTFGQPVRSARTAYQGTPVFEEWIYDDRQRLVQHTRPHLEGNATQGYFSFEYDLLDRMITQTNPDAQAPNGTIQLDHAPAELVTNTFYSLGTWGISQGASGVTRIVDASGNVTVRINNRAGLPIWIRDAQATATGMGSLTSYIYEGFNELRQLGTFGPEGPGLPLSIELKRDDFGRVVEVIDSQHGGSETTTYNGLDQVVETRDAAQRVTTSYYDGFGRLDYFLDDDGMTDFTYDGDGTQSNTVGRLVETLSASGQRVTYGYEPRENGFNRGFQNGTTQHLTAQGAGPGSGGTRTLETRFIYDSYARLERVEYPEWSGGSRLQVQYDYDSYGHNIRVSNATSPSSIYWELVTTDQGYRIGTERIGSASCGGVTGTRTTRAYDDKRGVLKSVDTDCGTTPIQRLEYGYDYSHDLLSRLDDVAGTSESFLYDHEHRLTHVSGVETFTYDPAAGFLWNQADLGPHYHRGSYDDEGPWLANAGDAQYFQEDGVGNVTRRAGAFVPGGFQTIEYTTFDLPRTVVNGPGPTVTHNFSYTADRSRAIKQGSNYAQFYAGDLFLRRETTTETLHRALIYVGNRAVAQVTQHETSAGTTTETRYLHHDNLGSIQTVTTESGTVESLRAYSPFGKKTVAGTSNVPFGFTGHEEDDELGLINMKGRMYDPYAGQFLTADPFIQSPYGTGLNRFAYVRNSPTNYIDPSGFQSTPYSDVLITGPGGPIFEATIYATAPVSAAAPPIATVPMDTITAVAPAVETVSEILGTVGDVLDTAAQVANAVQAVRQVYQQTYTHKSRGVPTNQRNAPASDNPAKPSGNVQPDATSPGGPDGPRTALNDDWGTRVPTDDVPEGPSVSAPVQHDVFGNDDFKGDPTAHEPFEAWGKGLNFILWSVGPGGGFKVVARGLSALSRAGRFGIQPYNALVRALKGSGLHAHHLIEQRFAKLLGQNARQGLSIAVTPAEHQAFTNAWRAAIPYGDGTATATKQQVLDAAKQIYANYPEILGALGL